MATQHAFPESATDAFKTAIQSFKKALNNDKLYTQMLQTSSIEQVYDMTDQLQKEQSKQHRLRNLAKIKPYLDRLDAYTGAIDTFVQAKPDILALIWGPIKLLIQWASVLSKSLDALIDMAAQIGYLLPKFGHAKRMFGDSDQIDLLLALFFQDILDFYSVALKFFTMPRESNGVLNLGCQLLDISDDAHSSSGWNLMFEAVWPKKKPEIEHIINRVGRHAAMLGTEVGLEHIQAAYEARTTDLEHFRKVHLRTKHTEYSILETAMAPTFYDKNLYELQDRLCEGTGDWILKHPTIQNWLDFSPEESGSIPRIVWLRGIPGAGKTFLAVCLIQKLRSMYREPNHVVFAILTHSLSVSTTSLSIFHSLIFQLARDHHLMSKGQPEEHESVLQDFICETDRGTLASSLDTATELLIKLLQLSGPVHIVIDGLDEIDERQRLHFLVQILKVSQSCPETRILIASRDEADIKAELESNATAIRADNCNASSIRHYVTVRCNQWIKAHNFSQEENQEIAALLEPIATKSQGMFMYAELILKGLDFLDGIDEIREELKVLPTDLKAAYGRIFSRINEQLPSQYLREKARKILGWVGCSPVPLTIQELDQALSIKVGDFCQIPGAYSTLKIVHLCGPVVEIVDNEVHFVHFTAKEFFFDSRISSHLSTAQYTLSLANVCITYLCQPHHDPTLDHGTIARHLWKGAYRLHHFAVCEWFNLIKACCLFKELDKKSESWRQLPRLLEQLLKTRANNSFQSAGETAPLLLENAESLGPEVYKLLCQEARFLKDSEMRLFTISKVQDEYLTFDPLKLRCTTAAVNRALEERICPLNVREPEPTSSAPCLQGLQDFNLIHLNYGTKLFKCPFVSCALYRNGYEDVKLRQSHAKDHQRPWRCEIPACEYSEIGFLSRRMRDEHLDQFHSVDHSGESITLRDKEVSEKDFSFASALIRANKIETMRTWIKQYAGDIPESIKYSNTNTEWVFDEKAQVWKALLTELASSGSLEMLQDVLGHDVRVFDTSGLCNIILLPAIHSANLGIVEWIAANYKGPHSPYQHYSSTLALAFQVENFHAIQEALKPLSLHLCKIGGNQIAFYSREIIASTANCPRREDILISLWKDLKMIQNPHRVYLESGLCSVAATTCSIKLASALLELGARADGRGSGLKTPAPLHRAAMKNSLRNARLMRFLLQRGANADITYRKTDGFDTHEGLPRQRGWVTRVYRFKEVKISDEVGTKGLFKWLGKSWEELIQDPWEANWGM